VQRLILSSSSASLITPVSGLSLQLAQLVFMWSVCLSIKDLPQFLVSFYLIHLYCSQGSVLGRVICSINISPLAHIASQLNVRKQLYIRR